MERGKEGMNNGLLEGLGLEHTLQIGLQFYEKEEGRERVSAIPE